MSFLRPVTASAFMAPEQARAVRALTPAVGVFSLGGVIAFAAIGASPFGVGGGADLFYRIVHQEPDLDAYVLAQGSHLHQRCAHEGLRAGHS